MTPAQILKACAIQDGQTYDSLNYWQRSQLIKHAARAGYTKPDGARGAVIKYYLIFLQNNPCIT